MLMYYHDCLPNILDNLYVRNDFVRGHLTRRQDLIHVPFTNTNSIIIKGHHINWGFPCNYFYNPNVLGMSYANGSIWKCMSWMMIQRDCFNFHNINCCWDYIKVYISFRRIFLTSKINSTWVHSRSSSTFVQYDMGVPAVQYFSDGN